VLFGGLIVFSLFGALTVQLCAYSVHSPLAICILKEYIDVYSLCFPHDKRGVKALGASMNSPCSNSASYLVFLAVFGIYLTMLVCLCLDATDLHFWFAAGFGDLDKFQRARFSGVSGPIVGSLVGLCVQLFFAYRISMFRQAVWLSGLVVVVRPSPLLAFACGCVSDVLWSSRFPSWPP
jgi:uncharacterized membrane protein